MSWVVILMALIIIQWLQQINQMAFYSNNTHSPDRHESFRFTVTDMKFMPSRKSADLFRQKAETVITLNRNHSASQQCFHRAIFYRRDKQKKQLRLQGNKKIIDLQEITMEGKAPMFMASTARLSSLNKFQFPTQKIVSEVVKASGQMSVRPHTQKRLPLIKFDVDFRRTKVKAAAKQIIKSPIELLTRKLQWEGKPVRRLVPYVKEELPTRFITTGKIHNAIERAACIRLSGWELQHSQDHGSVDFHL